MPCFLKFFSKSSGFNPTVVGVNESVKCGRYIRHEELLPPIITVLTNGDLSGDCKRKTVTIQTDLRDLEKNTQVGPITTAARAEQAVINIEETTITTKPSPKPATNPTPIPTPIAIALATPAPKPTPTPTKTPVPIPPPTRVKPIKKTTAPIVPSDTFENDKQCIKKRPQSRPIVPVYLEELKQKQHVLHPRSSDSESLPKQAAPTEDYVQLKPEPESTETIQPRVDAAIQQTKTSHTFTQSKSIVQESSINTARKDTETVPNKKKIHKEERVTSNSRSTSKQTRDSGVHLEENGQDEVERNQGDVLNPPSESRGRKEGLMFARPKLSKEAEKVIKVHEKDEKTKMLIRNAIEANDFLNNYMDQERKELVINAMEPQVYDPDSYIIRENEEGSEIYVSEEGIFDVIKNGEIINTLGSGIVFGELAILYNAKRFASIKAASRAKVWKIDRSTFRTIMLISGSMEREENLNFLRSAPFLKDLSKDVLLKVVDLLKRVFFPTNTCIVKQGDIGNDFFIIRGGTVTIRKCNEYGDERIVDRRKRGEYFGEQALLNEDRRQASVYSDAPGTECLKLDRESFISYLGTIPELKNKPIDRIVVPEERRRPSTTNKMYDHIELSHLERVATLGAGAFGRVDLVSYKKTQTFALKIIKKVEVIRQDQIDHIYSEKLVMSMCQSCPFIIELYKTYRDSKYVYFLMEVCLGGDVWTIMHQRKYFDERTAKFIVACVVEAFDFLHSRNIVYRDLKPENLMLTVDGYCKLVDFGFAKRLNPNYKTNTFAGTPEYVAPEIILDRGHDKAIDYWALGVLIHELLIGKPPFRGQSHIKIYQQILGGIESVKMSTRIPKPAQHLIKHLCKQLPAERLGYQRKGITDIKKHSWFDGFDWVKLEEKKMVSPIKRPVASNTDLSYFSPCMDDNDVPPDENSGWDHEF